MGRRTLLGKTASHWVGPAEANCSGSGLLIPDFTARYQHCRHSRQNQKCGAAVEDKRSHETVRGQLALPGGGGHQVIGERNGRPNPPTTEYLRQTPVFGFDSRFRGRMTVPDPPVYPVGGLTCFPGAILADRRCPGWREVFRVGRFVIVRGFGFWAL